MYPKPRGAKLIISSAFGGDYLTNDIALLILKKGGKNPANKTTSGKTGAKYIRKVNQK
jgi:hypothetical protein